MNFHSLNIEEVLDSLDIDLFGLKNKEVEKRLKIYGLNKLPEEKKKSWLIIFLKQFKNIFNLILLLVFIFSLFLNKFIDAFVILIIILVNALIGFFFEFRTEKTLEKLKELLKPRAKVLRDGRVQIVLSENLVPGDIVFIKEGDIIPADLRLFEVENLKIDESTLTGESLPVEKDIKVLPKETPIAERKNLAYMGTFVVEGKGRGIVIATGTDTYLGKIYQKYQEVIEYTPHFDKLAKNLVLKMFLIALFFSSFVFFISIKRHFLLPETILFILSSFVSAIPEGLPIIISLLLVTSAYSLYRKNILVKNLKATENLSVVNLLLTDKTGTLTENSMTVRKIFVDNMEIDIQDNGFFHNNKLINIFEIFPLVKLLNIIALTSEAEIEIEGENKKYKGDPRDVAFLELSAQAGIEKENLILREKILKREPFSRIKKHKRVIVEHEKVESYYIGAFERIINDCDFILTYEGLKDFGNKEEVLNKALEYAKNGFSVLATAFSEGEKDENLIFVGLIALYDPPKEGAKELIQKLKNAGIDIRILTGDHKETAIYIAKEIGFDNLTALEEKEIENLSDKELLEKIKETYIFSRITPETKLRILSLYQKLGYSIAYIGDGVNDVLNLKKADVGIAMGERGSEIAKSASDMILLDDNIENLIPAFSEGRKIFNNLKKVVFFLVTTNVAESITILFSLILGFPLILKPVHILFLNFVTDTSVGTTLAFEKEAGDELKKQPRKKEESLIGFDVLPFLLFMVLIMATLTIIFFSLTYLIDLDKARTYAFLVMSLTQIFNAFNLRSLDQSFFKLSLKFNPYFVFGVIFSLFLQILVIFNEHLRKFLGFAQIDFSEFIIILILSSSILILGEIYKKIFKHA